MFLFDLMRTRLGGRLARIAELADRLTVRSLTGMLRDNSIIVKPERWAVVLDVLKLPEYGVFANVSAAGPANGERELIASALLRVCHACMQSNVLALPDYQAAADTKDRKLYAGTLLRSMRAVWPAVQSRLQAANQGSNVEVNATQFFQQTASVGLQLSAEDCQLAWALLQQKAQSGTRSIAAGALDAIFRSDSTLALESNANASAHLSALTVLTHRNDALSGPCETGKNGLYYQTQHRRHVPTSAHQAATVFGQYLEWRPAEYAHADLVPQAFTSTSARKYSDRLYGNGQRQGLPWELLEGESGDTMASGSGGDISRTSIAPWMQQSRDENTAVTNNMKHVAQRLHALSTTTFHSFAKMLDAAHVAAGRSGLTRHALATALGAVGIRVDPKQAALLFAGASSGGRVAVTLDSMFAWLDRAVPAGNGDDAMLRCKLVAARKVQELAAAREAKPAVQIQSSAAAGAGAAAGAATCAPSDIIPAGTMASLDMQAPHQPPSAAAELAAAELAAAELAAAELAAAATRAQDRTAGLGRRAADSVSEVFSRPASAKGGVGAADDGGGALSSLLLDARAFPSAAKVGEGAGARSTVAAAQNKQRNNVSHIFNAPSFFDTFPDTEEMRDSFEASSFSTSAVHEDIYPSPNSLLRQGHGHVPTHSNTSPAVADISAAVVDVMQQKRAALALLFRRLTAATAHAHASPAASVNAAGAGLVTLRAFAETMAALVGGPLGDRLSANAQVAHKIACDIINAPYTCDANVVTLHFTDVICFLDAVAGEEQRGEVASSILRRLKDKCHVAASLQGDKLRLLMLTPQLRQRLKQRFLAGKSLGYQGAGMRDQCSAQDLVDVFECIDLRLSPLEAKFLCTATGDDEFDGSRTAQEAGTTLGAVVRFLSENVLV